MTYYRPPGRDDLGGEYQRHLCGWIQANGINYRNVVATGVVLAGQHILFTEFRTTKTRNGKTLKIIAPNRNSFLKRQRKVRCTVAWKDAPTLESL
jgi:hypothetical protein